MAASPQKLHRHKCTCTQKTYIDTEIIYADTENNYSVPSHLPIGAVSGGFAVAGSWPHCRWFALFFNMSALLNN